MILVSWLACLAFRPIAKRACGTGTAAGPARSSTSSVWMSSGFSRATCSMSTPPRAEAMNATALRGAVDEYRKIQFLGDVAGFADQHHVDRQRAAAGLVGRHASCRASPPRRPSRRRASCTSLTPPALPRPPAWICALTTHCVAAERLRGLDRLFRRRGDLAGRHRDAVVGEQLLGLVFVEIHAGTFRRGRARSGGNDTPRRTDREAARRRAAARRVFSAEAWRNQNTVARSRNIAVRRRSMPRGECPKGGRRKPVFRRRPAFR